MTRASPRPFKPDHITADDQFGQHYITVANGIIAGGPIIRHDGGGITRYPYTGIVNDDRPEASLGRRGHTHDSRGHTPQNKNAFLHGTPGAGRWREEHRDADRPTTLGYTIRYGGGTTTYDLIGNKPSTTTMRKSDAGREALGDETQQNIRASYQEATVWNDSRNTSRTMRQLMMDIVE